MDPGTELVVAEDPVGRAAASADRAACPQAATSMHSCQWGCFCWNAPAITEKRLQEAVSKGT